MQIDIQSLLCYLITLIIYVIAEFVYNLRLRKNIKNVSLNILCQSSRCLNSDNKYGLSNDNK